MTHWKKHFILLILVITVQRSLAQHSMVPTENTNEHSVTKDLVKQPKWEVGTDLLWLIDKNSLPRYSVLIRRNIGEHGALRIRGGYAKNTTQPHFPHENEADESSLIQIGYEYRKVLSVKNNYTKSMIYGGIDLFSRYQFLSFIVDNTITNPGQVLEVRVNETTQERGGGCFVGFKYFLTPYISLSAESSFQASNINFVNVGYALGFNSGIKYTIGSYRVSPLNVINLSYHF